LVSANPGRCPGLSHFAPSGLPGRGASVPDVALVVGDAVALEEQAELVLEGAVSVVLLLAGDVGADGIDARLAEGEGAVAGLPLEPLEVRALGLDPLRGALLHLLDEVGDADRPGEAEEDMRVVLGTVAGEHRRLEVAKDSAHVGVQLALDLAVDERLAVLVA